MMSKGVNILNIKKKKLLQIGNRKIAYKKMDKIYPLKIYNKQIIV